MEKLLFAWIGNADIAAASADNGKDFGPIGQAVRSSSYEAVCLLSDHRGAVSRPFVKWLSKHTSATISLRSAPLSSPVNFGEIYVAAVEAVSQRFGESGDFPELTFHLSPGTPAMAAVWIILAKTRFPARLIESSKEFGVKVASVPFDISADYIPTLLQKPDEELLRLTGGLPPDAPEFEDIIHRCSAMKRLIAKARRAAPRNIPVLLLGESGTGKELFARAIHRASLAKNGPFIAVNCGAIANELLESELFGHEKGAFTGAIKARSGYVETAHGGTLFLDEIGELALSAQVKILRVLQEKAFVRVGGTNSTPVDFRLIAATNKELTQEVGDGKFREDLFYRIAAAVLQIPPLRERESDVGLIIDATLETINCEMANQPGYEHKKLSAGARNILLRHSWPGNVREVVNTLQRAAVWSVGNTIDAKEASDALLPVPSKNTGALLGQPLGNSFDLQSLIAELARHYLSRAMEESGRNKTEAASLLGLPSYQTLTNWLRRYGLES